MGLMERIGPLAERIVAGYDRIWAGSRYRMTLTADAEAARQQIDEIISEYEDDPDVCGRRVLGPETVDDGLDVAEYIAQCGWDERDVYVVPALYDEARCCSANRRGAN
ncbi:hypothetical protein AWC32_23315 [Mycobacterium xenopi]|nr:hypothetical protein AWC32_23315 [Mycobacterium xenopi]